MAIAKATNYPACALELQLNTTLKNAKNETGGLIIAQRLLAVLVIIFDNKNNDRPSLFHWLFIFQQYKSNF